MADRLMLSLASLVPCGMASRFPMYVDTDFSRSNMASTYEGLTAPESTRSWPASRMASSLLRAAPGTLMWAGVRTSLMALPEMSRPAGTVSQAPAGRAGSTRGRGVLRVGGLQFLDDRVVLRAVHEVVDRHVLGRG